jgi:hypothetical protein
MNTSNSDTDYTKLVNQLTVAIHELGHVIGHTSHLRDKADGEYGTALKSPESANMIKQRANLLGQITAYTNVISHAEVALDGLHILRDRARTKEHNKNEALINTASDYVINSVLQELVPTSELYGDVHLQIDAFRDSQDEPCPAVPERADRVVTGRTASVTLPKAPSTESPDDREEYERIGYKRGWTEGFNACKEAALAVLDKAVAPSEPSDSNEITQVLESMARYDGFSDDAIQMSSEARRVLGWDER